jgi:hypothetical protein
VEKAWILNSLRARTWKQNVVHLTLGVGLLTERVSTEKHMVKSLLLRLKWLQNTDTVVLGRPQVLAKSGRWILN